MTIHREGYPTIAITALLLAGLNALVYMLTCSSGCIISTITTIVSIGLLLFIISFFRIPSRKLTLDDSLIVAPADGKVVVIEEVYDEEYFKETYKSCRVITIN